MADSYKLIGAQDRAHAFRSSSAERFRPSKLFDDAAVAVSVAASPTTKLSSYSNLNDNNFSNLFMRCILHKLCFFHLLYSATTSTITPSCYISPCFPLYDFTMFQVEERFRLATATYQVSIQPTPPPPPNHKHDQLAGVCVHRWCACHAHNIGRFNPSQSERTAGGW